MGLVCSPIIVSCQSPFLAQYSYTKLYPMGAIKMGVCTVKYQTTVQYN